MSPNPDNMRTVPFDVLQHGWTANAKPPRAKGPMCDGKGRVVSSDDIIGHCHRLFAPCAFCGRDRAPVLYYGGQYRITTHERKAPKRRGSK